jgi:hypothetical protein
MRKVFATLMCIDSHMIILVENFCHINADVKSHGESYNVYTLKTFLFDFLLLGI